jgi:hypothetical protein
MNSDLKLVSRRNVASGRIPGEQSKPSRDSHGSVGITLP